MVAGKHRLNWRPGETSFSKDAAYDRLAEAVRRHLDVDALVNHAGLMTT